MNTIISSNGNNNETSYPMCPWHYVTTERSDLFPSRRVNAVCNCAKSCLSGLLRSGSDSDRGKCEPVRMFMPVLVRDKCMRDGLFNWINAIEEVHIACVCTLSSKE